MRPDDKQRSIIMNMGAKTDLLTVDTSTPKKAGTGTTVTTPSTVATTDETRGSDDIRSPGIPKTPSIPDFITQTDRFGNATTPRTEGAIRKAQAAEAPKDDSDDDDAAETLLDSFRSMCCCLLPEHHSSHKYSKGGQESPQLSPEAAPSEEQERVKLLPPIHSQDTGKKCLVLDLDETLVHSSFRAVPGADFVIPVEVCM